MGEVFLKSKMGLMMGEEVVLVMKLLDEGEGEGWLCVGKS